MSSTTTNINVSEPRVEVTVPNYASKADPSVKQVVIAYDDKEGHPTGNEVVW